MQELLKLPWHSTVIDLLLTAPVFKIRVPPSILLLHVWNTFLVRLTHISLISCLSAVLTNTENAYVCSCKDYCNSLIRFHKLLVCSLFTACIPPLNRTYIHLAEVLPWS